MSEMSRHVGNNRWFTDSEVPDPDPLPQIKGWRVLVRPVPIAKKTKSGLILPDETIDHKELLTTAGRVLAMGPLCYTRSDMLKREYDADFGIVPEVIDPWCSVGDYVLYARFAGAKFSYGGVKMLMLNDDEILAVLDDPSKLL